MSYGYGLGVYFEDYNDYEDPEPEDFCDACREYESFCECPLGEKDDGDNQISDSHV